MKIDGIPEELKQQQRWLLWRAVPKADKPGKTDKPPHCAHDGKAADVKDALAWAAFTTATKKLTKGNGHFAGLGFALGEGWAGIDIDHCRDPATGEIDPGAEDVIAALDSYSEVSPSGTGVKVFVHGAKPEGVGCRFRLNAEWQPDPDGEHEVEVYDRERFFAVTGARLANTPATVEERTEQLGELLGWLASAKKERADPPRDGPPAKSPALDDSEVLRRAFAAVARAAGFDGGVPVIVRETPPGGREANVQLILNTLLFGMDPQEAIEVPRFATVSVTNSFYPHAYFPGRLTVEHGIPASTVESLEALGHEVVRAEACGMGATVAHRDPETGVLSAGGDPRRACYALSF